MYATSSRSSAKYRELLSNDKYCKVTKYVQQQGHSPTAPTMPLSYLTVAYCPEPVMVTTHAAKLLA